MALHPGYTENQSFRRCLIFLVYTRSLLLFNVRRCTQVVCNEKTMTVVAGGSILFGKLFRAPLIFALNVPTKFIWKTLLKNLNFSFSQFWRANLVICYKVTVLWKFRYYFFKRFTKWSWYLNQKTIYKKAVKTNNSVI